MCRNHCVSHWSNVPNTRSESGSHARSGTDLSPVSGAQSSVAAVPSRKATRIPTSVQKGRAAPRTARSYARAADPPSSLFDVNRYRVRVCRAGYRRLLSDGGSDRRVEPPVNAHRGEERMEEERSFIGPIDRAKLLRLGAAAAVVPTAAGAPVARARGGSPH